MTDLPAANDSHAELLGRTALVTGGARGIGLAIAMRLARAGANVAIADYNETLLTEGISALQQVYPGARDVLVDVRSSASIDIAINFVEESLGPVDILVNNAAVSPIKPIVEHTDDDLDSIFDTNLKGTLLTCHRVLPGMIERRHGNIINIASIAAFNYTVPHAPYAASKAGVVALTRDLAFEVAGYGIRVNCVAPGLIKRPQDKHHHVKHRREPPPWLGTARRRSRSGRLPRFAPSQFHRGCDAPGGRRNQPCREPRLQTRRSDPLRMVERNLVYERTWIVVQHADCRFPASESGHLSVSEGSLYAVVVVIRR